MGIRHASLTWNEENHLATGVKGNPERGLTDLGKQFIKYMNEHDMILDVSHLNEKSFYDVLNEKPKHLIASHSNALNLSNHPRNLTDEQLKAKTDEFRLRIKDGETLDELYKDREYTTDDLPLKKIGEILVIDTRDKFCTGIIVGSNREVGIDTRVVMIKGY